MAHVPNAKEKKYHRRGWAKKPWRQWYFWATHSRLKPVVQAALTIERHLQNVMTFFRRRITNAVSDGMSSKIQTIKKRAYGYRDRENFKTAICVYCGGLQLCPPQATHSLSG
jgi:transposase